MYYYSSVPLALVLLAFISASAALTINVPSPGGGILPISLPFDNTSSSFSSPNLFYNYITTNNNNNNNNNKNYNNNKNNYNDNAPRNTENTYSKCEAYDPEQAPITSPMCAPFVSKQIWVLISGYQGIADESLNASLFWMLQRSSVILPLGCYKAIVSLMCQTSFPTCVNFTYDDSTWSAPTYPCKSMCYNAIEACAPSLPEVSELLNCSMPVYSSFLPLQGDQWPTGPTFNETIDGTADVTLTCATELFPQVPYSAYENPPANCPELFNPTTNPDDGEAVCGYGCPDPSYSQSEWDQMIKLNVAISGISLILLVFLILSFLMNSSKRRFPGRVQIYVCISSLGIAVGVLIGGSHPSENTICADPTTFANQSNNGVCAFQAAFLMFFIYSSICWCFLVAFLAFLGVWMGIRPKEMRAYEKLMHISVWGLAAVFTIALLGSKSAAYPGGPITYCWLVVDIQRGVSRDISIFVIPFTIIMCFILLVFGAVLLKLATIKFLPAQGSKIHIQAQCRILIFVVVIFCASTITLGIRYAILAKGSKAVANDTQAWTTCRVSRELGLPYTPSPHCDESVNPYRESYGEATIQILSISSTGFWIFLGFGTDGNIYRRWKRVLKYIYRRDWETLWTFLQYGHSHAPGEPKLSKTSSDSFSSSTRTERRDHASTASAMGVPNFSLSAAAVAAASGSSDGGGLLTTSPSFGSTITNTRSDVDSNDVQMDVFDPPPNNNNDHNNHNNNNNHNSEPAEVRYVAYSEDP